MSTFYVLPRRPLIEQTFAEYLGPLFPGLPRAAIRSSILTELLESGAILQPNVFVVYREDLPDGEDLTAALADGFGAEAGDVVIEVRLGSGRQEWTSESWCMSNAA